MDLLNKLQHMRGKAVLVNGHRYQIDMYGIAKGVEDDDAKKMLQGKSWKVFNKKEEGQIKQKVEEEIENEPGNDEVKELKDMTIEQLKVVASEKGIAFGPNIGKQTLIERIIEADNEEDDDEEGEDE